MYAMLLFVFAVFSSINSIFSATYTCNSNSTCGCSALSTITTMKIIGGEIASDSAWSWIVSLQRFGEHSCGATLLSAEYAVTAAHCVADVLNTLSILSILAGT